MSESSINVTEGSGKRLHTNDRTISSVLVQEQFVLPGEYALPTYSVLSGAASTATTDSHILQLMAGSTNHVRIRRIEIRQVANATSATVAQFSLARLSTAGSGGTTVGSAKFDPSGSAAGATAQRLPSSKGTEGDFLWTGFLPLRQAILATSTQSDPVIAWEQRDGEQPIIIAAGTSNGLCVKLHSGVAGATVHVSVLFVETSYL